MTTKFIQALLGIITILIVSGCTSEQVNSIEIPTQTIIKVIENH